MVVVDLGSGRRRRGSITIDCFDWPGATPDIICHVGFEPIPLKDNSVDKVVAYDFLEHLPVSVYKDGEVLRPRIQCMKEVYRILKPGGEFYSQTPGLTLEGHMQWAQDPTHEAPPWISATFDYFCGEYGYGTPEHLSGIDFAFEKVQSHEASGYIHMLLRKPLWEALRERGE